MELGVVNLLINIVFVPNNDVSKARRMRIEKAVQYGATWIREWQPDITHIVVDNDLTYPDVLKFLSIATLPVRFDCQHHAEFANRCRHTFTWLVSGILEIVYSTSRW